MWDSIKLHEFETRRSEGLAGGGAERIAKQHGSGKLTARERLNILLDKNSFCEINSLVESRSSDFGMEDKRIIGDGVVTGYGKVLGRTVFVAAQDFTVNGGSLGEYHAEKICKAMDMALASKAPFISINDSGGARIEEGIDSLNGYGKIFYRNTRASGVIPQISVIMGPCAGGACYSPAITDFIFIVRNSGKMFITGPNVVKTVTREEISDNELGGADVHMNQSGVAHFAFDDEDSCLQAVRQLLSYLPQNSGELPPRVSARLVDRSQTIQDIVPDNAKRGYDVRQVIETFVDQKSFLEIQSEFAKNAVIGLARLEHTTVGIVANQPAFMSGSLDIHASDKIARFVRFCDCFNIPLITLVDVPAFLPGAQQEHNGIIRHGAKLLYAYSEATVPKITLIMRKAYGGAYIAMCSKGLGADLIYAWPIAEIAVMGAEGAVSIVGRKMIRAADDPAAERERQIAEYEKRFLNPYVAAKRGYIDEVILPEETRKHLASALEILSAKERIGRRDHGNIPL